MLLPSLDVLNILSTPVWVVSLSSQKICFVNQVAKKLAGESSLDTLRHGPFSVYAEQYLEAYLPALAQERQVIEILTLSNNQTTFPMSCRLSLAQLTPYGSIIIFEGLYHAEMTLYASSANTAQYCSRQSEDPIAGVYERFFLTNTAPMLLIDPNNDGQIVDANLAATQFYGYSREAIRKKHTWDINALGRDVLPIMREVAKLPGGHQPLTFIHKRADGALRHVQTYAGPVEIAGKPLMLCIIHDITEQKRLEKELKRAALRDPLTSLGNRRQFYQLVEQAHRHNQRYADDFSLLLVDVDRFKRINDQYGHDIGDEVLILLARTLELHVRDTDTVFRWGGEEFVILLPLTHLAGAMKVAESLRENIQHMTHGNLPTFTVSIGVAQHQANEGIASLFKRMDEALYRAKDSGRNKVMAAVIEGESL
jgi:diguanylate cyclase (GGDEF)-like protein/PAS domain S-box-containing protein